MLQQLQAHFSNTVGQHAAISKIVDLWGGHYYDEGHIPAHLITAPPGLGKTHLLENIRKMARALGRKPLFVNSGKELGTRLDFGEVCVREMQGKTATLIIDEFHEAAAGVQNAFRSMIEVSAVRKPREVKFSDDLIFTFDPTIHTVVLGTNRLDLVDEPFRTRLEIVELEQYSDEEIEEILTQMLRGSQISFEDGSLRMIAECNRGNARDIISWGGSVKRRIASLHKKNVDSTDVVSILKTKGILPKGVNKSELAILLALESSSGLQQQVLAAKCGCSPSEIKAHEKYLWRREFVRNEGNRHITKNGEEYLRYLRNCGFLAEKSE